MLHDFEVITVSGIVNMQDIIMKIGGSIFLIVVENTTSSQDKQYISRAHEEVVFLSNQMERNASIKMFKVTAIKIKKDYYQCSVY